MSLLDLYPKNRQAFFDLDVHEVLKYGELFIPIPASFRILDPPKARLSTSPMKVVCKSWCKNMKYEY